MKIKKCNCMGCEIEQRACYEWQNKKGCSAGLEFCEGHSYFFVIENKTGEFIVPYYAI
jgi:hypothetical protein